MNTIADGIARALHKVAPEADISAISPNENLREALDIDSFDFLNFLMGLHEALGIDIPESDYGKVRSLNALVAYLTARLPTPQRSAQQR